MAEREDISASEILDAAQEPGAPDYEQVTIKRVVTSERGITRFEGTIKGKKEERWTSAPASPDELKKFQQAQSNRKQST